MRSVKNRTRLDLSFPGLVFFPRNAPTLVIIFESVHLPLGLDFISGAGGQTPDCGSAQKLTTRLRKTCKRDQKH